MKKPDLKKILFAAVLAGTIGMSHPAHAQGIPVIDAANLAQAVQQVTAWAQQLEHMQRQISNTSGVRNMGQLAQTARLYLPREYQSVLNEGIGAWSAIYNAARVFDMTMSRLDGNSPSGQAFAGIAKQAALNRAVAEEAYRTAGDRFAAIQTLMDRINAAPDDKDVQDLQARIAAEQVMMQNEMNRLQTLSMLAQAQRDLAMQQAAERRMAAWRGEIPQW